MSCLMLGPGLVIIGHGLWVLVEGSPHDMIAGAGRVAIPFRPFDQD